MKLKLLLITVSTLIFLSSCDRKLYYASIKDKDVFQQENSNLSNENNIIVSQQSVAQNKNDSLKNSFNTLALENSNLKAENVRLKQADNEVIQVNKAIVTYFGKIAEIARTNTPPCINAANGWMRQYIAETDDNGVPWQNRPVNNLAKPQLTLTSQDANNLLTAFTTFSSLNQLAFINNTNAKLPHNGCCGTGSLALGHFLQGSIDNLISLGKDIVALIGSSGSDVPIWANTANDIRNLVSKINNLGVCDRGGETNANGVIARDVHNAAQKSLGVINPSNFELSRTNKIKIVLTQCFNELYSLQSEGFHNWLYPDWQIKYYTIMTATSEKLETLSH